MDQEIYTMDEKEEELDKRRPERGVVRYLLSSFISVICQLIPPVLCPLRLHAADDYTNMMCFQQFTWIETLS